MLNKEPKQVIATSVFDKKFKTDILSSVFLEALKSKDIKYSVDKTTISCQLSLSILSVGFNEENCLSPRYVNEAKRAALAYISTL